VLAILTFTLVDYETTVRLNTSKVILRSGVACECAIIHCVDIEGGDTYWDPYLNLCWTHAESLILAHFTPELRKY